MNVIDRIGHVTRKLSRGSSLFKNKNDVELNALPLLVETSPEEQEDLFIKKLEQCCVSFDFEDPNVSLGGKETKEKAFEELINFVCTSKGVLTDKVYPEILSMFSKNVFRVLPPAEFPDFDPENDNPAMEKSWPHLSLAYTFFLAFIESPNFNSAIAKKYIHQSFINQILDLLDSEDPRERDSLKQVLHRLYGKLLGLRAFIRKQIGNVFLQFIYETEQFNGVGELLEILGSIINGFALPLKEEHKRFLTRVLFPLHKPRSLIVYHKQLLYCVVQYVEKDPTLTSTVINLLLRMWPKASSQHEILFLSELEEILDIVTEEEFAKIVSRVFKQLARCMSSYHFQVAEKALSFISNECIGAFMMVHIVDIMPIIFPAIYTVVEQCNFPNVREQALIFLEELKKMDPILYKKCKRECQGKEEDGSLPRSTDGSQKKNSYVENNNFVVTSF